MSDDHRATTFLIGSILGGSPDERSISDRRPSASRSGLTQSRQVERAVELG